MKQIIWGVDPGNTGAFCRLSKDEVEIYPIPTIKEKKTKTKKAKISYDMKSIYDIISQFQDYENIVIIEGVGAMPDQGSVSGFNFGNGFGILQGIFCGAFGGIVPNLVTPSVWKKFFPEYTEDSQIMDIKDEISKKKKDLLKITAEYNHKIKQLTEKKKKAAKPDQNMLKEMVKELSNELSLETTVRKKDIDKLNGKKKYRSKEISRELASTLYPNISDKFNLVSSDGLAESLLIAHYWRETVVKLV